MAERWYFNLHRASDRHRDSNNDAFFTAESLDNLSEAVVRESIQNSLDAAKRDPSGRRRVRVRIRFVRNAEARERDYLLHMFDPVRRHFEAGLGIDGLRALFGPDCGYLIVEDFGTQGLTGDVLECRLDRTERNAFFSFFRAEGRSSKAGEKLGRWGIGKQVFLAASRLRSQFGVTVREGAPARVLMGSAVLRGHSLDSDDYQPDGWFGHRDSEVNPVAPVTAPDFIDTFETVFGLSRGNRTGLSILVPSVDDRINGQDLLRGVVSNFFWPILVGELTVDLELPEGDWSIDAKTVSEHRERLSPDVEATVEVASWASMASPDHRVVLPDETFTRPIWRDVGDTLLPEETLGEIRSRLEAEQRVEIRVPVWVRRKEGDRERVKSYFTVFVVNSRDPGRKPIFLRDWMVISDIRCPAISGIRALVLVDDPPLATFLGDAEGVNHTQWQKDSPKFYNKYEYGYQTILFVTRSVHEIMQRLHAAESKGDPSLLLDVFFLPMEDDGEREKTKKPRERAGPEVEQPPELPPSRPRRFILERLKGGFALRPGNSPPDLPMRIRIEAGYDIRRGNAINRWSSEDFTLVAPPLQQTKSPEVIVLWTDGNRLEIEIREPGFHFAVSGFDPNRDLVVRATQIKQTHETNV